MTAPPQSATRRRTTSDSHPTPRLCDAVGCAVEIAQIATRQKDDPHAPDPPKSILRTLCEEDG